MENIPKSREDWDEMSRFRGKDSRCVVERFFCSAKELIEQMTGGFDKMNNFVRETILRALEASHQHYEQTFKGEWNWRVTYVVDCYLCFWFKRS